MCAGEEKGSPTRCADYDFILLHVRQTQTHSHTQAQSHTHTSDPDIHIKFRWCALTPVGHKLLGKFGGSFIKLSTLTMYYNLYRPVSACRLPCALARALPTTMRLPHSSQCHRAERVGEISSIAGAHACKHTCEPHICVHKSLGVLSCINFHRQTFSAPEHIHTHTHTLRRNLAA